jgi:hypothetical protein
MKGVKKSSIPPQFDPAFLDWFRDRTEAFWASLPVRKPKKILAEFVKADVGGFDWQPETRWLGGLDPEEIAKAEDRWQVRFPPDYRLFLERLHAPDRSPLTAGFVGKPKDSTPRHGELARATYDANNDMVLREGVSFYNWSTDVEALRGRFEWLVEGLEYDVRHNNLWQPNWGPKPKKLKQQKARVREVVEQAPKLIPVYSHRYLLGEPCAAGNPVLSVYQSDIIVYGADLRDYLLVEFAGELGMTFKQEEKLSRSVERRIAKSYDRFRAIPFWGDLL